jgi:hypothetical protein
VARLLDLGADRELLERHADEEDPPHPRRVESERPSRPATR